jgi:hypothetical protein
LQMYVHSCRQDIQAWRATRGGDTISRAEVLGLGEVRTSGSITLP